MIKEARQSIDEKHHLDMMTGVAYLKDEEIARRGRHKISFNEPEEGKIYTADESMPFHAASIQVFAVNGDHKDRVASISCTLPTNGYREPLDELAFQMLNNYTPESAIFFQTGPENITAFVEGTFDPDKVLASIVKSHSLYSEYIPEFGLAADQLAKIRSNELLEDPNGTGARFKATLNGEELEQKPVIGFDGKRTFSLTYDQETDEIGKTYLSQEFGGVKYRLDSLNKPDDKVMNNLLTYVQDKMTSLDGKSGYLVEIYWDESAYCANTSANANMATGESSESMHWQSLNSNPTPPEVQEKCYDCKKYKENCICKKN